MHLERPQAQKKSHHELTGTRRGVYRGACHRGYSQEKKAAMPLEQKKNDLIMV
jgi:hypothetical protein